MPNVNTRNIIRLRHSRSETVWIGWRVPYGGSVSGGNVTSCRRASGNPRNEVLFILICRSENEVHYKLLIRRSLFRLQFGTRNSSDSHNYRQEILEATTTLHQLTYLRSWALLEELSIVQPLKNPPAFYGTRRFNTVFIRALHWSLSWAISIQ
jgi:hypothetical protein